MPSNVFINDFVDVDQHINVRREKEVLEKRFAGHTTCPHTLRILSKTTRSMAENLEMSYHLNSDQREVLDDWLYEFVDTIILEKQEVS